MGCSAAPRLGRWRHGRKRGPAKFPGSACSEHAGNEAEEAPCLGAFRQGLRDLGYLEPKNVLLENRFAAEKYERFGDLATELDHEIVH
jgi:hypothetical protein